MVQSRVSGPVFAGGVGEEYLGYLGSGGQPGEQAICPAGFRVGLAYVGKGKNTAGTGRQQIRRLTEPLVELTSHGPCDVGDDAVKYLPVFFILIHGQVEQMTQKSPALGRTEGHGVLDVSGAGVVLVV